VLQGWSTGGDMKLSACSLRLEGSSGQSSSQKGLKKKGGELTALIWIQIQTKLKVCGE